ncbi:MAG: hypothetical protein ACTSVB_03425 [Candidatus Heimdallarchaeaceae archaeon]
MKNWVISLLISIFILLLPSLVFSQKQNKSIICFSEETAKRMVVEIEQYRITNKQVEVLIKENQELKKQIEYLKAIVELQKKQLQISKETIENLQEIINYQNEAYKHLYKKSFYDKIKEDSLFLTLGILIGIAITL